MVCDDSVIRDVSSRVSWCSVVLVPDALVHFYVSMYDACAMPGD